MTETSGRRYRTGPILATGRLVAPIGPQFWFGLAPDARLANDGG